MAITQSNAIIYVHSLSKHTPKETCHIWTAFCKKPFNELLISWNALRPLYGHYVILSRVLIHDQWSPWLLYAVWGSQEQFSFHDAPSHAPVQSFQDQVQVLDKKLATGFCIRVETCNGAKLDDFYTLYACTSDMSAPQPTYLASSYHSFSLSIPNLSQLCLMHPRSHSFCSPTSTTAVIQYLLADHQLSPLQFAKQVYDAGFDIYGNWSFNIAQAFVELGPKWQCFCTRLPNMEWLWLSLRKRRPIVISIKGFLPGTFLPYPTGHLIVVKGYDAASQHFLCMDPAFPSDNQTEIAYPWQALVEAWRNRHYLAYFFFPKNERIPFTLT